LFLVILIDGVVMAGTKQGKSVENKNQGINSSVRGAGLAIKLTTLFIALVTLTLSGYAFVFMMIAMLPTISAVLIDKRLSKAASSTIGAFNLVGILPYLDSLLKNTDVSTAAQHLIGDIYVWFYIYGAAGVGWLVVWMAPHLWATVFVARAESKIKNLREAQDELVEEWSEEVSIFVMAEKQKQSTVKEKSQ
jgi:hypothetical protein